MMIKRVIITVLITLSIITSPIWGGYFYLLVHPRGMFYEPDLAAIKAEDLFKKLNLVLYKDGKRNHYYTNDPDLIYDLLYDFDEKLLRFDGITGCEDSGDTLILTRDRVIYNASFNLLMGNIEDILLPYLPKMYTGNISRFYLNENKDISYTLNKILSGDYQMEFHYPSLKDYSHPVRNTAYLVEFKRTSNDLEVDETIVRIKDIFSRNKDLSYLYLGIINANKTTKILTHSVLLSSENFIDLTDDIKHHLMEEELEIFPFDFKDYEIYLLQP